MDIKEITIFSILLGLDLFFASLALGTKLKRKSDIALIAPLLTLVQSALPFIGLFIGHYISAALGDSGANLGAVLLILIGYEMLRQAIKHPHRQPSQSSILLIYIGAGIEGFFAGISMGALETSAALFLLCFAPITFLMIYTALRIGSTLKKSINLSIDALVGAMLMIVGLFSLLNLFRVG